MTQKATSGEAELIVGDSLTNSDLYYATHFVVGVPVMYLNVAGEKTLLVNDLEYGRAGDEARVDALVSTTPYEEQLRKLDRAPSLTAILDLFLTEKGIKRLIVPGSFPFGHAQRLQAVGYELEVRADPFIPERIVKTPEEIEAIIEVQNHAEEAMGIAVDLLRKSEIRGDSLWSNGKQLTAETVRVEMQKFLLEKSCEASAIIVAGGDQGADPHHRGSGPLPANQTIVIDVFPHSTESLYWGDMTRTFVRGRADAKLKQLYKDVLDAQEAALAAIRDGVPGNEVHEAVVDHFKECGRENGETNGKKTGFIHSTGHGLGLDIHELPRLGRQATPLRTDQVVTVEPGLYYPGFGSVRIEDLGIVTSDGCRNLNRFPKELEI